MELRKIKMFLVVMAMLLCFSCEREVYISDKMYLRQMNYKEQSNNEVRGSFFMFYGSVESNNTTTHKVKVLALNKGSYSFHTFNLKDVRIFIVGIRKDLNKVFNFPEPKPFTNYLENILEKENKNGTFYLGDLIYDNTFNDFVRLKTPTKLGYIDARFNKDAINFAFPKSKTRRGRVGVNYAQTIDTQCNQGIAIDGSNFRRFTINECVKLFGFNEDFKPNKNINQAYKQFGNSIIVDKLEAIIKQLI